MAEGKKLVHEDGSTMVIQNEDGSTIKVAKRGLHKYAQDQLRGMCHGGEVKGYAEGGPVEPSIGDYEAGVAVPIGQDLASLMGSPESLNAHNAQAAQSNAALAQQFGVEAAPPLPPQVPPAPAVAPAAPAVPGASAWGAPPSPVTQTQPGMDPSQIFAPYKALEGDIARMQATGTGAGIAESRKATAEAEQLYNTQMAHQQAIQNEYSAQRANLDKKVDGYLTDLMSARVDPTRVWTNADSGQRASALVGIILGGIGAGLTRSSNQALQIIDKMIERDIDAQKVEIGKRNTMLEYGLKQYGNMDAAANFARMMSMATLDAQQRLTAARMGTVEALQRSQMASLALQEKILGIKAQLAGQLVQGNLMAFGMQGGGPQNALGSAPTMPDYSRGLAGIGEAQAKDRARTIGWHTNPDGTQVPVYAHDEAAAGKARERLVGVQNLRSTLRGLEGKLADPRWQDIINTPAFKSQIAHELVRARDGQVSHEAAKEAEKTILPGIMKYLTMGSEGFGPVHEMIDQTEQAVYGTYSHYRPQSSVRTRAVGGSR